MEVRSDAVKQIKSILYNDIPDKTLLHAHMNDTLLSRTSVCTWHHVYAQVLLLRDADVCRDSAVFQRELEHAVSQRAEQEEAVRIPRPKLETHRHHVVLPSPRQLQETCAVEGNREGVRCHTGECQITLEVEQKMRR